MRGHHRVRGVVCVKRKERKRSRPAWAVEDIIMKTTMVLGMAAVAFTLVACGAGDEEKTESSQDSLSASCITGIKAPPGSPAYQAELQKCLEGAGDVGGGWGGGVPGGGQGGDDGDDGWGGWGGGQGGGQSCTSGISCVNGACTCTSGPAKGQACDGTTATGANSCSVLCKSCN